MNISNYRFQISILDYREKMTSGYGGLTLEAMSNINVSIFDENNNLCISKDMFLTANKELFNDRIIGHIKDMLELLRKINSIKVDILK